MIEIFIFFIGSAIGSFLNVLIDRLPHNEKITGRSHCDFCKKGLRWYDLVPIFSFIFLKGKCRYCKKRLSLQYPLVEILTGAIFLLIYFEFRELTSFLIFWSIASVLIVIFFSDLKYHLISDYLLLALFIFSFIYHLLLKVQIPQFFYFLVSGLVVTIPIFLIYFFSKERAMGLGDVYLITIIGFLLGWQKGFMSLYIAVVTGAIVGLTLIILKIKKMKGKIAFGPFLVLGTVIMFFWGEKIMELIKRIYGF